MDIRESILDLEGPDRWSSVPLLEREREVDRIGALIERARGGRGGVAAIQGPAGIGKSRLLNVALDEARTAGFEVLVARGGELEQGVSWGVARELFGQIVADPHAQEGRPLLVGAAALAGPVLGIHSPDVLPGGPDAAGSALHGLYWLVSDLCDRDPVMLAVDDVHWADLPSLRLLGYLGRRVEDLPLVILVAGRPAASGPEADLIARALTDAEPLRPAALSETAASEVVDRILAPEPDPELVHACHEVTGGNPFLLRELCLELRREGVGDQAPAAAHVREARPEAIRQAVLLRLSPLPHAARELASAAAVLGREASLANAAALAELSRYEAAEAADLLEAAAILTRGLPLGFVHPIVRSVVYESIPPAHRARLHAQAMKLLNDSGAEPEAVAAQALAVEGTGDQNVVEVLRAAARAALSRGAPANAVSYLRRALDEPPPADLRGAILAELGEAEATAGDMAAVAHVEEALALLPRGPEQASLLLKLGQILYAASRLPEAANAFSRGLEQVGDSDDEVRAELWAAYLGVSGLLREIDIEEIEASGASADADGAEPLTIAQRQMLTQHAVSRVFFAHSHDEARSLALRALGEGHEMLGERGVPLTFTMAVSCLFWSGALDDAERYIEVALERARAAGDLPTLAYVLFGRSQPRYWKGQVVDAAADAGAAVEAWQDGFEMHLPFAGHWRAVSIAELGEFDAARDALETSAPRPDAAPIYEAFWRVGRQRVALAQGDYEGVRDELEHIRTLAPTIPYLHNPTVWPWRSDGALALHRLGDERTATDLVDDELRIARQYGLARPIGTALRVKGLIVGGSQGVDLLREALSTLEALPDRIEFLRALVDLGAALRRVGERAEGRDYLRRGLELAHELGARTLEGRAREELAASGARLGRLELSGPESLTPSERRVAELAAGGSTNRAIAQQLFVSLRTVETHLTHVYQKLDISSRRELADALPSGGLVAAG
ncbi:MAG: helix-turn-helix transcriptional regulator [Solirubrobacterales bacterium]